MLFLAYVDGDHLEEAADGPWRAVKVLRPGLALVDSDQSRSTVYHAIKGDLPDGTALLVAELDEVPKFKGMAAGSLAWARGRT